MALPPRLPRLIVLAACLLPTLGHGEDFLYRGHATLAALSGRDCGALKIGDTLAIELALSVGPAGLSGYSRLAGNAPTRFSGVAAGRLPLRSPDPGAGAGDNLSLSAPGGKTMTGILAERLLGPHEAGCNLSRGVLTVRRAATGAEAAAALAALAEEFGLAGAEYAARARQPGAYAELQGLLAEADAAASAGDNAAALALFERLQPLQDRVHGHDSRQSLDNLAARATLLTRLGRPAAAANVWRQLLQAARASQAGQPRQIANAAYNLGDALERAGDPAAALAAFAEAGAADAARLGADHPEVAASLARQAALLRRLGRLGEAVPLLQRLAAIRERSLGASHPDTTAAGAELAWAHHHAGQDEAALARIRQVLAVDERARGANHADTARDLNYLALILRAMGKLSAALPAQRRALAIYRASLGPAHLDTMIAMRNLADLHLAMADYDLALPLYLEAVASGERILGPEHPETATTLGNLAFHYKTVGRYEAALPLYRRALAIDEKALGTEHPDTATDINNLAALLVTLGDYGEALALHRRALAIREKVLGPDHPGLRGSLGNLTVLHQILGDYETAMAHARRALAIAERSHGASHPDTAGSLHNLAALLGELGRFDQALAAAGQAAEIYEKTLGPSHPLTATALDGLANLHLRRGQPEAALPLRQRALAIRERTLGADHIETASSLNNLGSSHWRRGALAEAAAHYRRALAISERRQGPDHAETAVVLNNLALVLADMGSQPEAQALLERALRIRRTALGEQHALTGITLANLAFSQAAARRPEQALAAFAEANAIAGRVIERVFAIANEKEKLAYVQQQEWAYFGQLSLVHRHFAHDPNALRQALDLVLVRKGIVFDALARQNEALADGLDPAARALWEELAALRGRQARLARQPAGSDDAGERRRQARQLDDAVAALERRLADASALAAARLGLHKADSAAVARRLPADGVLAEFVRIDDYDWARGRWSGGSRYLVFLLHADARIDLIDLGAADRLDGALREPLRRLDRIGLDQDLQQEAARRLHQLLWQPLAGAAGAAGTVVFSPDGLLNLVPFAAMLDDDGRFFVENHGLAYVTSGRELVRPAAAIAPDSQLFLAANPAFDPPAVDQRAGPATAAAASQAASRAGGANLRFEPLPGTQAEAEAIAGLIAGARRVVTGHDASEGAVRGAGRPRIMHLATHGFFLADLPRGGPGTRGAAALAEAAPETAPVPPPAGGNPLLRSGLALAGANRAGQSSDGGGDDGLLTALEVTGMNLHGTDLVTLSACETGRGEVQSGEGVFGLRRAFALAGARHLVMSLWPVGDEETARQMDVFYRHYAAGGRPAEALGAAQRAALARLRANGKAAEPALWAPFIVQGW